MPRISSDTLSLTDAPFFALLPIEVEDGYNVICTH